MSDYQPCLTCGEWDWIGKHKCSPAWEVRQIGDSDDEWYLVHAVDDETAAEKFCEMYDRDGEYSIVTSGSAEVEVRKPGSVVVSQWHVAAETVAHYSAFSK